MKIVGTDNHAQETVADGLWLDNIDEQDTDFAKRVCDRLNKHLGDGPGTFYTLKPDSYVLSRGMEDLI